MEQGHVSSGPVITFETNKIGARLFQNLPCHSPPRTRAHSPAVPRSPPQSYCPCQCSQPSSPSVFVRGLDGRQIVVPSRPVGNTGSWCSKSLGITRFFSSDFFEFLTVFPCPQTAALLHAFLYYIILSYFLIELHLM